MKTPRASPSLVFEDPSDPLEHVLGRLQRALLEHPVAAQALFGSLVREGRAFARTDEGRRLAQRLNDSPLIRRGRLIWDVTTIRALDDDRDTIVPSALVEAFVKLTMANGLEPLLSQFFEEPLREDAD